MKSTCDITLGHRIIILIFWLLFLIGINYLVFATIIWKQYWFAEIVLVFVSWFLTYLLVKNTRYNYEITDWYLIIKTPRIKKHYKIPLSDVIKIWIYKNIPFHFRIWMKYDFLNKILFLCWYSKKWIILKLKDFSNQIVICPRKFDDFYNEFLKYGKK